MPDGNRLGHWYQFSLRTLFVLLTIFCIWLGVQVSRATRLRALVAAVAEVRGEVYFDYQIEPNGQGTYARPPGPRWLRKLVGDEYLADIRGVSFPFDATDAVMLQLCGQKSLTSIVLSGHNHVTDAGLERLNELTNLQVLWLDDSHQVTDAGLKHLNGLAKLRSLYLYGTQVTDAGIADLKKSLPHCDINANTARDDNE